jgi:transposase
MMIEVRSTNAAGLPVGHSNTATRYADDQVAAAKALRAKGESITAIAHHLAGPHRSTVSRWLSGQMRRPAVSVRVVRTKPRESLAPNHQQQREEGAAAQRHTVGFTAAELAALRVLHGEIA